MKKNGLIRRKTREFLGDSSGTVAVIAGLGLLVVLGAAALTVDIGRIAAAKSELQKAADAGALAGARAFNIGTSVPNWSNGQNVADQTAKENKVDGQLVSDCQVEVGYWDLSWNQASPPANLKPPGTTPGPLDIPAVRVTISKSTGHNGGPLSTFFAPILGQRMASASARAVASLLPFQSPVDEVPAGGCFPLATPISWVTQMWKNDQNSDSFRIGSSYHDPDGGQWTSFLLDVNNVPAIRDLIDYGNPTPLKIGDQIWIEPGTKTTLYDSAATRIGQTVLLPIVPDNFDTHAETTLLAFVPLYIEDAQGGSDKYIQGHFVPNYQVPGGGGDPTAPNYGATGTAYGSNAKLIN
jgi:Flp pilus assembly protein TadG